MSWGEVELEPEVRDWFLGLGESDQARVRFHVDRLAAEAMRQCLSEEHSADEEER